MCYNTCVGDFMNKSIDFLNNNIMDNSSVVIAVSGGPDSMALLSLLLKIRDYKKPKAIFYFYLTVAFENLSLC